MLNSVNQVKRLLTLRPKISISESNKNNLFTYPRCRLYFLCVQWCSYCLASWFFIIIQTNTCLEHLMAFTLSMWPGFLYVPNRICGREGAANLCLVLAENKDMSRACFQIQKLGITPRSFKVKVASPIIHIEIKTLNICCPK